MPGVEDSHLDTKTVDSYEDETNGSTQETEIEDEVVTDIFCRSSLSSVN